MNKEVALAINAINAAATVLTDKRKSKSVPAIELNSAFWSKKAPSVEDEEILDPKLLVDASIFDVKKWGRAPRSLDEMVKRKKTDLVERAAGWLESKLPKSIQQQIKMMNLDGDEEDDSEEEEEEEEGGEKEVDEDTVEIGDDKDQLEVEEEDYGFGEEVKSDDETEVRDEDIEEETTVEPNKDKSEASEPKPAVTQKPAAVGKRVISISKEKESIQNSFDDFFKNPLDEKVQGNLFTSIDSFIHVMTKVKEARERKEAQDREAEREAEREKRQAKRQQTRDPLDFSVDLSEEGKTRASVEADFRYFQRHGRLP